MAKRNERLDRFVAGARELLRTLEIAVCGLRQDPLSGSRIAMALLDSIQGAAQDFQEIVAPNPVPPLPAAGDPPRRRGPGRPKRLPTTGEPPAVGENHQDGAGVSAGVEHAP